MKTFIIAEAGVNHNGSIEIAKKLVDVARYAKADAVKFQTFRTDSLVSKSAPKADYQIAAIDKEETQYNMLRKLELGLKDYKELVNYSYKSGIMFLSSPFGIEDIELLTELGLKIFKIPSGEITNLPYLRKVGMLGNEIIMSTGMADMNEIKNALDIIINAGTEKDKITVLHCNTDYPTPFEDVNLNAMLAIKNECGVKIGYSDHTTGIEVSIAAVALGAEVIEKHFTLDKSMEGPDHRASLEPDQLRSMVSAIRNIERSLGDGSKKPSLSELKNRAIVRKSIVAGADIAKGEELTEQNLVMKRPGTGISPMKLDTVIGKRAKRDFKKDEIIEI